MPLLLLLPLLLLVLVALWLVLLPISIWARYRSGRARRRAQGWVVRGNAWLLAMSVPVFLVTAWFASHWFDDALRDGCIGLLIGALLGFANVGLTRYERDAKGLIYTPNRWIVLTLTTLVALRIAAGVWMAWQHATSNGANAIVHWIEAGAWTGVAGVFLGYALAFTWGLRARLN